MFVALFNVFGDEKSGKNLIQNTWKVAGSSPAGNILFHFFIYLLQFFLWLYVSISFWAVLGHLAFEG